ncbi:MAG TPA: prepilin-type N-terminal cleavage/methylation domain-containing protein [Acetobacteraceae bacterium]|nr:prepilin-type N-terminal cleavage/methylation domain-containing protein [Acetobacteraceae bacterium]
MRTDPGLARADQGFTLLEVLVAFVIAALALAVLFHGALGGLRAARIAGRYEEALARARSHMAAFDNGAVAPQDNQGDDGGGYHYHVRAVPVATATLSQRDAANAARSGAAATALYAVSVAISWHGDGGERTLQLQSERLGPAPARAP